MFTDKDFDKEDPGSLFGSRGVTREVVEGAFFPYDQGDKAQLEAAYEACDSEASDVDRARARRAPGVLMHRWAVPGADPEITPEMRPEWAVLTPPDARMFYFRPHIHDALPKSKVGEDDVLVQIARHNHVKRSRNKPDKVARGCTAEELETIKSWVPSFAWEVTGGGDHGGKDTDVPHVHVPIAKYLFKASPRENVVMVEHAHEEYHADFDGDPMVDEVPELWERYRAHMGVDHGRNRMKPVGEDLRWSWERPALLDMLLWFGQAQPEGWERYLESLMNGNRAQALDNCAILTSGAAEVARENGKKELVPALERLEQQIIELEDAPRDPLSDDEALHLETQMWWETLHQHKQDRANREVAMARRLSWHPYRRPERWEQGRVFFALEGCLKEAALVSAGEATFSCPSVSLWDAPELKAFADRELRGKRVFIVCDSDWNAPNHEQVIRLTLLARDRLRHYGVEAHMAAPPETDCKEHDGKHGVDDFLGHGGDPGDLVVVHRDPPYARMVEFFADQRDELGRRRRADGVLRDEIVLTWIATHADPVNGETRVSLKTVTDNVREELGHPVDVDPVLEKRAWAAAYKAVKTAVEELTRRGAITQPEPLHLRSHENYRLNQEYGEWVGRIKVAADLRAKTYLKTVRDFG